MHIFPGFVYEISPLVNRGAVYVYAIGTESVAVFLARMASLWLLQNFITRNILQ